VNILNKLLKENYKVKNITLAYKGIAHSRLIIYFFNKLKMPMQGTHNS